MTSPNTIIADMQAELAAARAEIERVTEQKNRMWFELAAEQATNMRLREALEHFFPDWRSYTPLNWRYKAVEALSTPSDTSALEAYVTKAGEKMRVNCITAAGPEDSYQDDWIRAKADACDAIRALPAVTLADIKPC